LRATASFSVALFNQQEMRSTFLLIKKPSGQDAHGCIGEFIASQYASGAEKVSDKI
jgi:hypothetical protein